MKTRTTLALSLTAALLAPTTALAANNCEYQFSTDNSKSYSERHLSAFLESGIRGNLNRVNDTFNVHLSRRCENYKDNASFTLGMETDSLYILNINGHTLPPDVVKYTNTPLTISRDEYEVAFNNALKLSDLPKETQQSTLKMMAFIIAEAARFTDVEDAANTIFHSQCSFQWNDYSNLLRHWKTMSIFANSRGIAFGPQYIGGTRAFLIAPITTRMRLEFNDAVSNGWEVTRYNYDQREHDKPVYIGEKQCDSTQSVAQQ